MEDGGIDSGLDAAPPAPDARTADTGNVQDARGADAAPSTDAAGAGSDAGTVECDASEPPVLPSLALTTVIGGRDRLVYAAQPRGSSDWYLVSQRGRIEVFTQGAVRPQAFLDLTARIDQGAMNANPGDERGLLSIAFPPDYATSGKFYVGITPSTGADANKDLVIEFQRSSDPFVADANSGKTIVELEPSAGNHNGGTALFGPDGFLYVGTGDGGGGCNDDGARVDAPQKPSSLFGKILRLDPKAAAPYAAAGNPYSGASGDARVLHIGLRNPFRFGFDAQSGDLYIPDVGQNSYEEISIAPIGMRGLNFGWAAFEGAVGGACGGRNLAAGTTHMPPVVSIDVRDQAPSSDPFRDYVSIIGGPVYRGTAIPALAGVYLFGDYEGGRMGALRRCGTATSRPRPIRKTRDPNTTEAAFGLPSGVNFRQLTAIVEDSAGELYFVVNRNTLMKVVPGS